MAKKSYPAQFLKKLKSITAKRAKTVIDHILAHGQITTEELKTVYKYNHPPRAIHDVKDFGIPIEMFRVTGSDGRSMAAYTFGDPSHARGASHSGRTAFSKAFKKLLIERDGNKCAICSAECDPRYLQIDHRVPYAVAGDSSEQKPDSFMLICSSCNRAKSWSCEHCQNLLKDREPAVCRTCYWASPTNYEHISLNAIRRMDLTWTGAETFEHQKIIDAASTAHLGPTGIRETIDQHCTLKKAVDRQELIFERRAIGKLCPGFAQYP